VGCAEETFKNMAIIYPKEKVKVFIPRELDGFYGKSIFEIAHRNRESIVFWHLDDTFIGTTKNVHKMEFHPSYGNHKITLIDDTGENLSWNFEVLEK
jgi:penicillin-binding protein 1C